MSIKYIIIIAMEILSEESDKYLRFKLNCTKYCINSKNIIEISKRSRITYFNCYINYIVGTVKVGDEVVPVLDLKKLLRMKPGKVDETFMITFLSNDKKVIFLADEVEALVNYLPNDIIKLSGQNINDQFIVGLGKGKEIILDPETLVV